jgi:hypothetical protein
MSRRLEHAVEIAASAEACWQTFCRIEEWPRWFPTMQRVERSAAGPLFVGEALTLHLAFRGHGSAIRVRVEEVAPRRVRWVGKSFGVTGDHAFYVEAISATRCRFVSDETFFGFPVRLIPRFVFDELRRETDAGLERFRRMVPALGT